MSVSSTVPFAQAGSLTAEEVRVRCQLTALQLEISAQAADSAAPAPVAYKRSCEYTHCGRVRTDGVAYRVDDEQRGKQEPCHLRQGAHNPERQIVLPQFCAPPPRS